jgi:hypothetical protein
MAGKRVSLRKVSNKVTATPRYENSKFHNARSACYVWLCDTATPATPPYRVEQGVAVLLPLRHLEDQRCRNLFGGQRGIRQ